MKRIIVNGYTYETDLDVNIGDVVEFPTADWLRDVYGYSQEGVVTASSPEQWLVVEKGDSNAELEDMEPARCRGGSRWFGEREGEKRRATLRSPVRPPEFVP